MRSRPPSAPRPSRGRAGMAASLLEAPVCSYFARVAVHPYHRLHAHSTSVPACVDSSYTTTRSGVFSTRENLVNFSGRTARYSTLHMDRLALLAHLNLAGLPQKSCSSSWSMCCARVRDILWKHLSNGVEWELWR